MYVCNEFLDGTAPKAKRKRKSSSYTPVVGADRKRLPKNASPQERQEWNLTAKKECIVCEEPHLKSEWDVVHSTAWAVKAARTCATCRGTQAPKKQKQKHPKEQHTGKPR